MKVGAVAWKGPIGRLDDRTAANLDLCLEGHINRGTTNVVLDCGDLEHISSLGLGTLVRLQSRMKNKGGRFGLANVDDRIADILHIVHFEKR